MIYPYERWILLAFATCRAIVAVAGFVVGYLAMRRARNSSPPVWIIFGLIIAVLFAFLWSDGIEPLLKLPLLGTDYNPYFMAIGEWEGWTGPTSGSAAEMAAWHAMKCGAPPGGNAHPLLIWWGNPGAGCFCKVCQ